MSPEKRQRLVFLTLAVLLHAIVFYLVCHMTIFPATPAPADDSSFQRIATPARPVAPPAAPSASAPQMPSFAQPAASTPVPVVPIVTSMPNTFTMPKIDTTAAMNATMARILTTPVTNPGGTNNGSNTGSGSLGASGFATASSTEMESFLHNNPHGEIAGVMLGCMNTSGEAAALDAIRQKDITSIGWYFHETGSKIPPGIKHGMDVPSLTQHPEWFAGYIDELMFLQITNLRLHNQVSQGGTLVLVWDFHGDYDPGYGQNSEAALCASIVTQLRAKNVRLCIISFENAPWPPLLQYVKESGGAVLYPKGIPAEDTASQLLQDSQR